MLTIEYILKKYVKECESMYVFPFKNSLTIELLNQWTVPVYIYWEWKFGIQEWKSAERRVKCIRNDKWVKFEWK